MKISLERIEQSSCYETPELRERFKGIAKSKKTICYRAIHEGREVAFVALDRWPELNQMVLYELFVPRDIRRQDFGTAVLGEVERIAQQEGFLTVRVSPQPLDNNIQPHVLIEWYRQRRYQVDPSAPGEMKKCVTLMAAEK